MVKLKKEQINSAGSTEGDSIEVDENGNFIFAPNETRNALTLLGISLDESIGNVSTDQDGYVITYNHSIGKYEANAPSSFDFGLSSAGDILQFNGVDWIPGSLSLFEAGEIIAEGNGGSGQRNIVSWGTTPDILIIGDALNSGTIINGGEIILNSNNIKIDSAISSPEFYQEGVIDLLGQDLTIRAQGNNSATFNAGNLILSGGLNSGAGNNGIVNIVSPLIIDGYTSINNDLFVSGKLTVLGLIDPTGLVLDNQVAVPGGIPSAGKSTLWIRDSDGYFVITDEGGNDNVYMPNVGGYITIENEGTPVAQREVINLPTGSGLVAADVSSETSLTVANLTNTHIDAAAGIAVSKLAGGATGTVLAGGSPNSFTANPAVTSLALGTDPATSGALRLTSGQYISTKADGGNSRNILGFTGTSYEIGAFTSSGTSNTFVYSGGDGSSVSLAPAGSSRLQVSASLATWELNTMTWAVSQVPLINQVAAGDAVGSAFTLRAQGNNSAASAAGNLVLGGGTNAGAGASGVTQVMYGAARVAEFGAGYLGLGTAPGSGATAHAATGTLRMPYGFRMFARNVGDTGDVEILQYGVAAASTIVLWNGVAGVSVTPANVVTLFASGGITLANGVTASSSISASGFVQGAGLTSSAANIQFTSAVASPTISQATIATATITGQPLTIQAQDCSGTTDVTGGKTTLRAGDATGGSGTRRGGYLLLRAGRGATTDGSIALHADPATWHNMCRGIFVGNASVVPTGNPADGFYLYGEAGAGKGRGSSGTITTFIPAEPHCPDCGRDFAHEWENEQFGKLAICQWCIIEYLVENGLTKGIIRKEQGDLHG